MRPNRYILREDKQAVRWQVDCRAMPCPFPLFAARAAITLMREGELLIVLATDPQAPFDLPAWCRMTGNSFVKQHEQRGVFAFLIRKGSGNLKHG
jgi:tRNA 2-thiouridine synthesizing protein A